MFLSAGGEQEDDGRNQTGHQPGEEQGLRHGEALEEFTTGTAEL